MLYLDVVGSSIQFCLYLLDVFLEVSILKNFLVCHCGTGNPNCILSDRNYIYYLSWYDS